MKQVKRVLPAFALGLALSFLGGSALALEKVRVGVLAFGTVNWELDAIKQNGLASRHGIELEVVPLASGDASRVALQGGAVDIVVSDWLWVARQRAAGRDYAFYPYSNAVGSLMVDPFKGPANLQELTGKRVGMAGGANDKSWLLMRAYTQKTLGKDLADMVEPQFAAPPLLNRLMLQGDLDGTLTFWHFGARLSAAGMRPLLSTQQALQGLGVQGELPLIGWVFSDAWAAAKPQAIAGFLAASYDAKQLLKTSDEAWDGLRKRMKAKEDITFAALRAGYREGIPGCFGPVERQATADAFGIFSRLGGQALVGTVARLDPGMFWSKFAPNYCPK